MRSPVVHRVVALVTALALVGGAVLVALVSLRATSSSATGREVPLADGSLPLCAAFLGDSITVGNSDLAVGRLGDQSWFRDLVTGDEAVLVFAGAVAENGRTTDWMADHVDVALATRPDLLVVLGGTNDAAIGHSPEQVAANLHRIADAADRAGTRLAVATVPPLDLADDPTTVAAVNAALRDVADERGALLLDVAAAVTGDDGRWRPGLTDDGIHPSGEGAAAMAAAAARALRGRV